MQNFWRKKRRLLPMKPGISTSCLYPLKTELSLKELTAFHPGNVEIFVNAPSELNRDLVKEMRKTADDNGTRVLSLHPFTSAIEPMFFFSDYEQRFYDGLEMYKRFFEMANLLGAEIFVFHGDRKNSFFEEERYFERFEKLKELGKQFDVTVAQENVARCRSSSIEFLQRMKKQIPDVSFVLDLKQAVRSGHEVMDVFKVMGKNIAHVHISDHTEEKDCLPLGEGSLPLPNFIEELEKIDFHGGIIVELYRNNFESTKTLYTSYKMIADILSKN